MGDILESTLEEPMRVMLETRLARELLLSQGPVVRQVRITARGETPAGQWSQPDLVLACIRRYRSRAIAELELYGFELKVAAGFDVSAVHQALAHTRYVHFSHLVVHCPDDELWQRRFADVGYHAHRHGIGLIRLMAAHAESEYEIALRSKRFEPRSEFVDRFLEDRLPDLLDWVEEQLKE